MRWQTRDAEKPRRNRLESQARFRSLGLSSISIQTGGLLNLVQDLKFSFRQLRKAKVFAVVAIATRALGIGGNTAIFSVFYGVLLRPLGFSDPGRLVILSERATNFPMLSVSWKNFQDWNAQSTSFEEFGAARVTTMALTGSGQPEQVPGQMISGNLLHMLGTGTVVG